MLCPHRKNASPPDGGDVSIEEIEDWLVVIRHKASHTKEVIR